MEKAFELLHALLTAMEVSRGNIPAGLNTGRPPGGPATPELERLNLVWTRLAVAVSGLFLNSRFESLNLEGLQDLLLLQKQLASLFHASSLETSDAALQAFNLSGEPGLYSVAEPDLYKVLLLYSLESQLELDLITGLEAADAQAVLFTCIALCSTPFCGSERAYRRREELLRYLCGRLERQTLEEKALFLLTGTAYMFCSYANSSDKHQIKGAIHRQWRQRLAQQGLTDLVTRDQMLSNHGRHRPSGKPLLLVLHEWLASGSAMHRCYASWLTALKDRFHTVGMGQKQRTGLDPAAIGLFSEYVALPEDVPVTQLVAAIRDWCQRHQPAMVYYPSLGMATHTVAAASIRLAPIQVMTQGHPASSGGSCIDYLVSSADYCMVGDQLLINRSDFSEEILVAPPNSMTWTTPASMASIREQPMPPWREPDRDHGSPATMAQIVVSATPMKLGHPFLDLCARVARRCEGKAFWHFFIADGRGALHLQIIRELRGRMGDQCNIYPNLGYADYVRSLQVGDLFLVPFPFGNSNTLFDYYQARLPGLCLRSNELSSTVDMCLFRKLGFPDTLIADTVEDYEELACKFIFDGKLRKRITQSIYSTPQQDCPFSQGDPGLFAETVAGLIPAQTR